MALQWEPVVCPRCLRMACNCHPLTRREEYNLRRDLVILMLDSVTNLAVQCGNCDLDQLPGLATKLEGVKQQVLELVTGRE